MKAEDFLRAISEGVREFHFTPNCTHEVGPRGGVFEHHERWRVNGNTKTWVRRPGFFQVPFRVGFRGYGYITHDNVHNYEISENCPDAIAAAKARSKFCVVREDSMLPCGQERPCAQHEGTRKESK